MRIMQGTKVVEAPQGWRTALVLDEPRVVVDVGAGDGRWVYENARDHADSVFIAIDPDAEHLAEYAYRASRKASRGGVDNAAFVVAPVEALPSELDGIADVVRVNFPWGSLLRGLLEADQATLAGLRRIAKRGGSFEAVMSYDPSHDTNAFAGAPLPPLTVDYIDSTLTSALAQRGLSLTQRRQVFRDEALALPSTWGRRLLHARPRDVYFIGGIFV
jgi:16S rRNA (adenine(1408)-N(1))-methyltransferase